MPDGAGVLCGLATVVSTAATRHQYSMQNNQLPLVFCQLEDDFY
jgi:hypothetical protein